jgi:hypothetical protein
MYDNPISYFFKKNKHFHNSDEKLNNIFIFRVLKIFQDNIDNDDINNKNMNKNNNF